MGLGRDIVYAAGMTLTSPVWGLSLLKTGKWRTDWRGRFGRGEALPKAEQTLLIHAVSVGEVNATRTLVAWFREHRPKVRLVVSVTTNSGTARAEQLYAEAEGVSVVRFPLDFSGSVKRFLERVQPNAVALMELEVWPNFVDQCDARGVPVCVVNGRLSERSFKGYRKAKGLLSSTFAKLTACGVQTADYAQRFEAMGARRVTVLDTMKWDTARIARTVDGAETLGAELGLDRTRPIVVAGSTAPGEHELLLDALAAWPAGTQLVMAPRKPEWFDQAAALVPGCVRRSQGQPGEGPVFLLDTIGELRQAYALADVCVVGRSFTGALYGSDMMEPIALGKATVIGPHYSDFHDTVEAFVAGEGILVTENVADTVAGLLATPERAEQLAARGIDVIRSRQGATERYAALLCEMLDAYRPDGKLV